jgi:methionine-S-sulfoxide reductase
MPNKTELAVLAGGCFWGVEDLIRQIPGVVDTDVGYTGGTTSQPTYETVKTGSTGHAEAIRVEFDPAILSYEKLLEHFFKLHDPTTLNRQGNDIGTQYRSTIFVETPEQRAEAEKVIAAENKSGRWTRPVLTTIENASVFYPAEGYHQDYLQKNPGGYTCHYWRGPGPV